MSKNLNQALKLPFVAEPHINSFNYIYEEGLQKIIKYLPKMELFASEFN